MRWQCVRWGGWVRSTFVWWFVSAGGGTWRVGQCGQGALYRGYAVEVLGLPDVPVQCRPIHVGVDGLGLGRGGGSVESFSVVCS